MVRPVIDSLRLKTRTIIVIKWQVCFVGRGGGRNVTTDGGGPIWPDLPLGMQSGRLLSTEYFETIGKSKYSRCKTQQRRRAGCKYATVGLKCRQLGSREVCPQRRFQQPESYGSVEVLCGTLLASGLIMHYAVPRFETPNSTR